MGALSSNPRILEDTGEHRPDQAISPPEASAPAPLSPLYEQVAAWNATAQAYPRDRCLPQLVAAQAAATPQAVALVAGPQVLTYQALDTRANQVAWHLRALGVGPEVLVGLCLERSTELVVGALGIHRAGGAYVPLDPAYPPERLSFMLHDARAPVVVTQQRMAAQLSGGPWQVVALDADGRAIARQPPEAPPSGVVGTHLAYVIYTSGSTGRPKGVEITHESLLNLVFWHRRAFAVTPADRATQLAGLSFDATVWELWPYLTAGARIYLPDEDTRVAPEALRDWMVAHGITIGFLPTALAERVLALEWPPQTALRFLLTGGDALHHYPVPTLPFTVVNNYGLTETTVVATSGPVPPAERPDRPPSIGRPIANTQVYILDADLQPVSVCEPGELYIGGVSLARGYLGRPELTAERFIPSPLSAEPGARLYKTGDRACYGPDGQIAFLGRIDDQIKMQGYRIEPTEIATVLNRHPAVQTSLVAAREDILSGKRLVAYVVLTPGPEPSASALRDFLGTQLPLYMVPTAFVRLQALPLTANDKVDRAALPAPDATNTLRDGATVAPRTPVEERLSGIVAPLLGRDHVGVDDNFFLLGGHSLLGTQVIARVADAFGVELPLRRLFEAPTVAELSVEIERLILARVETMSEDEVQRLLGRQPSVGPPSDYGLLMLDS